jgi:hypothetical protein
MRGAPARRTVAYNSAVTKRGWRKVDDVGSCCVSGVGVFAEGAAAGCSDISSVGGLLGGRPLL